MHIDLASKEISRRSFLDILAEGWTNNPEPSESVILLPMQERDSLTHLFQAYDLNPLL